MYTLSLILLAVFCIFTGVCAFFCWDASWLRNMNLIPVQALLILIGMIFLCAVLLTAYRWIEQQNDARLKRLAFGCMILLILGQLAFLFLFRPVLRHDPLKIFDMAVEMLRTHTISETYGNGYFARYTNNYPLTILTYWILRLLSGLGVPEPLFMPTVQLLNIGCITVSLWLGYLILKEWKSRKTAAFYLILCVLCPLSYVWGSFFYTTTVSMPCLMGILYLYLRISGTESPGKRALSGGLLGLVLILGYKLRATAFIAFIAVAVCAALFLYEKRKNGSTKNLLSAAFRKYAVSGIAFLCAAALSLGFWSMAVNRYVKFDYRNTGFPAIHWVMMGASLDGGYNQADELYTFSFETKEEKSEAAKKVLLERVKTAGPAGLLSLAGKKLLNTWVDGTDHYQIENGYAAYGKAYDYLLGNKSAPAVVYAQIFRTLQMLAIGFMAIRALLRLWKKKEKPLLFPIQLTLLGGMAFHLIWETNPLYSISFTFLSLMLLADALITVRESAAFPWIRKNGWIFCASSFCALFLLLVFAKKELVETPIEELNYCVNQYQFAGDERGYVTEYEDVYTQTFTTDRPFNRIAVRTVNPVGEYNQSAFQVRLTDAEGNVLYNNDRFLSGMVVKDIPYEFLLGDTITPAAPTTYTLEIIPGYIQDENSLEFLSYHTGNYDVYEGGSLSVGGEEEKKSDLAFAVYEYKVTTYYSLKIYLFLCAGLLLLTGAITVGMWHWRRKES